MTWLLMTCFVVICFWATIQFMDTLLRTCHNHPYVWLMDRAGLVLKFGQLRWTTTRYNRAFVRLGSRRPRLAHAWFNAGAACGLAAVGPAVYVLAATVSRNVFPPGDRDDDEDEGGQPRQMLSAVLPGVNLPTRELPFYVLTLVFCIVFHELGHALAAVREEIRVLGCGLTVIGVLPAAFVDISTDAVQLLSPWRQLKIFCAGVWHNAVLAALALALLAAAPYAFAPGYARGTGVTVQHVQQDFPAGLSVGDHVTAVNGCPVTDFQSWYDCLARAARAPQFGSCVPDAHLAEYKWNTSGLTMYTESIVCCSPDDPRGVCFAWINPSTERQKFKSFSCLPTRDLLERSAAGSCLSSEECDPDASCIAAALDNTTRLVRVQRTGRQDALYVCQVSDLYYSVSPSEYVPRSKYFPILIPYVVEMFLKYAASFSGALALLNAVPCYALDGQWIFAAFVDLALGRAVTSRRARGAITACAVTLGTALLGLTVITGLKSIL